MIQTCGCCGTHALHLGKDRRCPARQQNVAFCTIGNCQVAHVKTVQILKRRPVTQGRLLAGVWDLTTAYARQLKSMSLVERKKEAAKRVQSLINAHKGSVTLDMVKKNTRQPEPYSHPSKTSVTEVFTNCILPLAHKTVSNLQASHGSQPHYTLSMTTA